MEIEAARKSQDGLRENSSLKLLEIGLEAYFTSSAFFRVQATVKARNNSKYVWLNSQNLIFQWERH